MTEEATTTPAASAEPARYPLYSIMAGELLVDPLFWETKKPENYSERCGGVISYMDGNMGLADIDKMKSLYLSEYSPRRPRDVQYSSALDALDALDDRECKTSILHAIAIGRFSIDSLSEWFESFANPQSLALSKAIRGRK